ncbi:MAG TPA: hypothetical protein VG815_19215 [Chloroflexota bacterium]|nr:hypothetical protein [Chloroflexota bacterium]
MNRSLFVLLSESSVILGAPLVVLQLPSEVINDNHTAPVRHRTYPTLSRSEPVVVLFLGLPGITLWDAEPKPNGHEECIAFPDGRHHLSGSRFADFNSFGEY